MSSFFDQLFKKKTSSFTNQTVDIAQFLTLDKKKNSIPHKENIYSLHPQPSRNEKVKSHINSAVSTSSIFNAPMKTGSLVENFCEIIEEHVIDNLGAIFYSQEQEEYSAKFPEVSADDFKSYVQNLRTSYNLYTKEKKHDIHTIFENDKNNFTACLMQCYSTVPSQFFEGNYYFDFQIINKNSLETQNLLDNYLDQVQKNLYYQISSKFDSILDSIEGLIEQENRIQKSLERIRTIRNNNSELKETNFNKIIELTKLKRRQLNMQKTLKILDMINLVKKITPTLKILVQKGNFDRAIKLLESFEQPLKQKFKSLCCLNRFQAQFDEIRNSLQHLLSSEFEKRSLEYLSKTLCYVQTTPQSKLENPLCIQEDNVFNLSPIKHQKDANTNESDLSKFEWALSEMIENNEEYNQIANIILAHLKIKEISLMNYRPKLNEMIKKFHKQFLEDMDKNLSELASSTSNNIEDSQSTFTKKIKFLQLYFKASKRFLLVFSDLINKILSNIVVIYINSSLQADDESKITDNNQTSFSISVKALTQTAKEFCSVFSIIVRCCCDRITQLFQLIEFNKLSCKQFLSFSLILDEIISFFKEVNFQERLYPKIEIEKETTRILLKKVISGYLDQIPVNPLISLKLLNEKQYLQYYFSKARDSLLKLFGQEKWQTCEISSKYIEAIKLVFEPSDSTDGYMSSLVSISTDSSETNSIKARDTNEEETLSPHSSEEKIQIKDRFLFDGKSDVILIKDNSLIVAGKIYKLTTSLLELIQNMFEFVLLAQRSSSIYEEALSKVFTLLKMFNSAVKSDILEGNAGSRIKSGVITPDILAFSASSLILMRYAISNLKLKFDLNLLPPHSNLENLANQTQNEIDDLVKDLKLKITDILRNVVLIEKCLKLKSIPWANPLEKFSVPTSFSNQILDKIKSVYRKVSIYLSQEFLFDLFQIILNDIAEYYLPIFGQLEINDDFIAKRVKKELEYFVDGLKNIQIFENTEVGFEHFEKKVALLISKPFDPKRD